MVAAAAGVAPFDVSPEPLDCGFEDVQAAIGSVSTTAPNAPATSITRLRFTGFPFICDSLRLKRPRDRAPRMAAARRDWST